MILTPIKSFVPGKCYRVLVTETPSLVRRNEATSCVICGLTGVEIRTVTQNPVRFFFFQCARHACTNEGKNVFVSDSHPLTLVVRKKIFYYFEIEANFSFFFGAHMDEWVGGRSPVAGKAGHQPALRGREGSLPHVARRLYRP